MLAKNIAQNSIFEEAKNVAIKEVCERYFSLSLRKAGKNLVARCPFHEDRTPSFVVFPATGRFKCFGCGAGGDGVSLVALALNLLPVEAARLIARDFGLPIGDKPGPEARRRAQEARQALDVLG